MAIIAVQIWISTNHAKGVTKTPGVSLGFGLLDMIKLSHGK